eukprot:366573-Chlamydomonas_euryale.AAC.43
MDFTGKIRFFPSPHSTYPWEALPGPLPMCPGARGPGDEHAQPPARLGAGQPGDKAPAAGARLQHLG